MKRYIKLFPTLALAAAVTACADYKLEPFDVAKPESVAQYEYLSNYEPLKTYIDRAAHPNFHLGGAIAATDFNKKGVVYELITSNFDEMTAGNEMKYSSCVSDDGTMNFTTVGDFVENAREAGITIYGHTLAWHSQQNNKYLNSLIASTIIPAPPIEPVEEEVKYEDYSTYTSFPFYVMGYTPEFDGESLISRYPGEWYQYFVADGITAVPGDDYSVTICVKGSSEGTMNVQFGNWGALQDKQVSFGEDWSEVTIEYPGCPDITSAFVVFQPGTYEGEIRLKWLKVTHSYTPEVASDGGHCLIMSNPTMKDNNYNAQVFYKIATPFQTGVTYNFKAMAKATEAYTLSPFIQSSTTSDQQYPAGWNVGTEWTSISGSFTVDKDNTYDKFTFNIGTIVGDIYLDDVSIMAEGSTTNLINGGDFEDGLDAGWQIFEGDHSFRLSDDGQGYGGTGDQIVEMTPEEKKDTLTWAMDNWINGMMEATGGYVTAWDAVNEAISGADHDGDGIYDLQSASNVSASDAANNFYWQDYLGDIDYVRTVIRLAREHFAEHGGNAADLKLFINDYNLESDWDDNAKVKSLVEWINRWEADGVTKIDGIGSQMHVSCYLDENTQRSKEEHVVKMFEIMAASGKLVKISELDMGLVGLDGQDIPTEEVTYEQALRMADYYQFIIEKYFEIIPVSQQYGITQWCMTDSPANSGWRANSPVGLWDLNYNRKPAYGGFANGLAGEVIVVPYAPGEAAE